MFTKLTLQLPLRFKPSTYVRFFVQHCKFIIFALLKKFFSIYGIVISVSCALLLGGCSAAKPPVSGTGFYFDTVIQVTIYDSGKESCLDGCMELADKYEKLLSPTIEGSDIWNINHSGGQPVAVSDETRMLLEAAVSYCDMTNGRIDLTIETVSELWDFHAETDNDDNSDSVSITKPKYDTPVSSIKKNLKMNNSGNAAVSNCVPSEQELAAALSHVDYHNLLIDGNTVSLKDPESSITLGFIAKGFIADKMKEYLLSRNIESAIINLGGNLLAVGSKPDGAPFQFGIQKPFDEHGTIITSLPVSDRSLVTSGVYERYFYQGDVLYHHILNPTDGYPVKNNLFSVTILSDSSMAGDALSTSCLALGLEEGMEFIESLDGVEAVFITEDYGLHYSSGL